MPPWDQCPTRRQFLQTSAKLAAMAAFSGLTGCKTIPAQLSSFGVGNGIDQLEADGFRSLEGMRLGLVTNHTGHNRRRTPTIDLLFQNQKVKLTDLFSPEHGIRGQFDEKVNDSRDEKTGLPVHSLYGERRTPSQEQLRGLDAVLFDIQDIGARFYTYASTMANCLTATAQAGIRFIILDRVNPITGRFVEGPVLQGATSFVGFHTIPLRHGMTMGELATLYRNEKVPNAKLEVIRVANWRRDTWFDGTGLPWTNPSPNMRSLTAAALYPGLGLLETAISVGRGTDAPFELIGAPYIDDLRFAATLNEKGLPGIRFVPIRFTPKSSTFKDQACGGVQMIVTDRNQLLPVRTGIQIALVLQQLHGKAFASEKMAHLLLHPPTLEAIRKGEPWEQIESRWQPELNAFLERRKIALLYT